MSDERFAGFEIEREGPVLRLWLNRPERRNAITNRLLKDLGDFFLSLQTDFDTRVVVIGGRGKSFCAGFDRKPDPSPLEPPRSDREARWLTQIGRRACRAIEECEAVTIARVHGHAIGGGSCFAMSCDFRVAAHDALFRIPEVELGIPLTWGAAPRLIHEIGAARARELLLLCDDIDGRAAHTWGMVHRAVPAEHLDAEVDRLVGRLLEMPELAVTMTKTQLRGYARLASLGDASEEDGDMLAVASRSEDARARFALPPK